MEVDRKVLLLSGEAQSEEEMRLKSPVVDFFEGGIYIEVIMIYLN